MNMKPCETLPRKATGNPSNAPVNLCKRYRNTRNHKIIEQFVQSGERCVLLDSKKYRDAVSCLQSITASIKRYGYTNVEAHMRSKQIYLVRSDMMGDEK